MDRRILLGQRLMMGFDGMEIPDSFVRLVKQYKVGNVILFRRNIQDADQLRSLCESIQHLILEETGIPALIAIDQEGGTVTRLSRDCVNTPGSMACAAAGGDTVFRAAEITARQLKGVGVNCNFAPDLDVNDNPDNPVIGVRSFGDDPFAVGELGAQAIRGYQSLGVMCCGKHFPGHGNTAVDSHLGLPVIDKTLDELKQTELVPFCRGIRQGIPAIMSSHILFPKLDEKVPATMSRRIMTELLREDLGFDGLVFSDCMMMDAIQKDYGTAAGTVAAVRAGVDICFVRHTDPVQEESAEALLQADLDEQELISSFERITRMKSQYAHVVSVPGLNSRPEDFAAARQIARDAITLVSGTIPRVDEHTLYVGCDGRATSRAGNMNPEDQPFSEQLKTLLGGTAVVTGTNPAEEEIRTVVEAAAVCSSIVLVTINAHMRHGQLRLAEALSALKKPMLVAALRNPYDLSLIPSDIAKLAVWDCNSMAAGAMAEVLCGGACTGKLPVRLPEGI